MSVKTRWSADWAVAALLLGCVACERPVVAPETIASFPVMKSILTTGSAIDFADGFELALTLPWVDISTSAIGPAIIQVADAPEGTSVFRCAASGGNVLDTDCGVDARQLNPGVSTEWDLHFEARDLTSGGGGWIVGVGNNQFGDSFHIFEIESDGTDILLSIDGDLKDLLPDRAFVATRVLLGVSGPTAKFQADEVIFSVTDAAGTTVELSEGFEGGIGPIWRDISTSSAVPTTFEPPDAPEGSTVFQCLARGGNVSGIDCGIETTGLNPSGSSVWKLRYR